MRLFHQNTENYIKALAATISKDPASLENWRCLHIRPVEGEEIDPSLIERIRKSNKNSDCDIVVCEDHDVLLISQEMDGGALRDLAELMTGNSAREPELRVYDLLHDWRTIRAVLLAKTGSRIGWNIAAEKPVNFGEVDSLMDVFAEAKLRRKVRQPQYVMIVDDDALTRRLVAGAFKDKYALITACDAPEAVANYLLFAPDIVFLDIGLPDINGFAVLRQIIASDPDAYVVMFSGNSYLDNVTTALGIGAAGFIAKPFKRDKLNHYIEDSAMHHRKFCG